MRGCPPSIGLAATLLDLHIFHRLTSSVLAKLEANKAGVGVVGGGGAPLTDVPLVWVNKQDHPRPTREANERHEAGSGRCRAASRIQIVRYLPAQRHRGIPETTHESPCFLPRRQLL